jgi:prolipoprotein diacylglyceryl transferase
LYPILFSFNFGGIPIVVTSYAALMDLAILVGLVLIAFEARRAGFPLERLLDLALIVVVAGVIGARLYYVVGKWDTYAADPLRALNFGEGGLVYHGGLFAGLLAAYVYTRVVKTSFLRVCDLIAPALAIGETIARLGCLLNGCCYGAPTDSFLGMYLPNYYGEWTARFPTPIIQGLTTLVIFFVLWALRKRTPFPGFLILLYLVLYSGTRFFIEFTRDRGPLITTFGMDTGQLVSVILVVVGLAAMAYLWRRKSKPQIDTDEHG